MSSALSPLLCGASVVFAGYLIDYVKTPVYTVVMMVAVFDYTVGLFSG